MPTQTHHVVVLGASPKRFRFSNQAVRLLKDLGYRVTPVHPQARDIEGLPAVNSLQAATRPVHTLTLYVNSRGLAPMADAILELAPERVIFNPGTECPPLEQRLKAAGIPLVHDCTLIMLSRGSF